MRANTILRSTLGMALLTGSLLSATRANAQSSGETPNETARTAAAPAPLFPAQSLQDEKASNGPETSTTAGFLPLPRLGPWIGYAKWGSLGTAAGLATLGFLLKENANSKFDRLVRRCEVNPQLCRERNPDGSYAHPELEDLFQDVRRRDRQAQLSLIAGQVSFGLSLALFIFDWQQGGEPGNIPYEPEPEEDSRLELRALPGELSLRYYIR